MKTILFYLFLIFLIGCQSSNERSSGTLGLIGNSEADYFEEEEMVPVTKEKTDEFIPPRIKQPDKIIKEANIKFEVDIKSKKRMETYFLNQELKFGLKKQLFRFLQQDDFS